MTRPLLMADAIAIALGLGLAPAAQAQSPSQSSVSVYGLMDASFGQFQSPGTEKVWKAESGNMTTSFLGFKGSEPDWQKIGEALWVGIGKHEKGAEVWNKHLDESK